ncbi:hypothetical protein BpHYR1_034917 [Brachionus plicatilis]|uniref:Uncharacterized protein n=1 Tax=Brachionus plicatilis TaxID=10195 RepID=A0A3M7RY93_BRAPC|nr:hypothetical protein BpHYR1_034917 [Brachionus plicatilis]
MGKTLLNFAESHTIFSIYFVLFSILQRDLIKYHSKMPLTKNQELFEKKDQFVNKPKRVRAKNTEKVKKVQLKFLFNLYLKFTKP